MKATSKDPRTWMYCRVNAETSQDIGSSTEKMNLCGGFHSHADTPIAGWFLFHGKPENKRDDDWE